MRTYNCMQVSAAGAQRMDMIAHDLRTPLSSVSGAAQMALQNSSQGKTVDMQLRQILAAVEAMDVLLKHMCGQDGGAPCTAERLEKTLRSAIGPHAQQKGQSLSMDLHALSAVPEQMEKALERILLNLASNAVKYTQEGGDIRIQARRECRCAVITVSDNGMGMKREFLRRICVPHARAQESCHLPGKGLGMSIVHALVSGMGGKLRVRSTWGKGTVFTVQLPLKDEGQHAH